MITLADVARLSETSLSTASRALRSDPRITAATTERVRQAAQSLGYQPNRAARSLATGRSGIVGLVVPVGQFTGQPYGAQLVDAVTAAASARDNAIMLWLSYLEPSGAMQESMANGIVDGLIISIMAQEDPWVDALLDGALPVTLVGRHARRNDLSYATIDNVNGTRELMTYLQAQGYQRLATIRGPVGSADADERHAVFVEALGGEDRVDPDLVAIGTFGFKSGYAAAQTLIDHRPDCIVAGNDQMARGAIAAIVDAGLSVPGDIGVTGWDDLPDTRHELPALTTVRHDIQEVGAEAMTILLELINGAPSPIQRLVPSSLVVGASTQPALVSVSARRLPVVAR